MAACCPVWQRGDILSAVRCTLCKEQSHNTRAEHRHAKQFQSVTVEPAGGQITEQRSQFLNDVTQAYIYIFFKIHRLVIQSTEFQLVDEWKRPPQWQCPGCPVEKESLVCDPPSFCSCKMCSLFLPWLSHSSKHPASFSFSLSHSCSLSLACAFSITQSLSLSLSLSLSRSPSTPHWQGGKGGSSEVASGANCPPPSPAQLVGGSWADLCKRAIQTQTSGLQRFHNLGERRE